MNHVQKGFETAALRRSPVIAVLALIEDSKPIGIMSGGESTDESLERGHMSFTSMSHISDSSRHKPNRFRERSLAAAAVGLTTATSAGMASAAIIYPDPGVFGLGTSISIDGTADNDIFLMTGMMGQDIFLDAPGTMGMSSSLVLDFAVDAPIGMIGYLSFLGNDVSVDGSLFTNSATSAFLMNRDATDGNWQIGDTGFAGFSFFDGTRDVYGYLQLTFTDANTLEIAQVAYESDGSAILTPSTPVATPEPGTALLVGLGLAGLSLAARRARRSSPEANSK